MYIVQATNWTYEEASIVREIFLFLFSFFWRSSWEFGGTVIWTFIPWEIDSCILLLKLSSNINLHVDLYT